MRTAGRNFFWENLVKDLTSAWKSANIYIENFTYLNIFHLNVQKLPANQFTVICLLRFPHRVSAADCSSTSLWRICDGAWPLISTPKGIFRLFFVQNLYKMHESRPQSLGNVSIEKKCENGYNIYIGNLREICYSLMGFSRK